MKLPTIAKITLHHLERGEVSTRGRLARSKASTFPPAAGAPSPAGSESRMGVGRRARRPEPRGGPRAAPGSRARVEMRPPAGGGLPGRGRLGRAGAAPVASAVEIA